MVVIDKSIARTPDMNVIISGECLYNSKGAYTPTESSRVHSSPVRLTKTQQRLCDLLIMTTAAVRTHQQSRVESSHTSLAESRVVMLLASFSSARL